MIRSMFTSLHGYEHNKTLTIIQMWVYESQLVAGGGRVVFGSLGPAKGFLSLVSRPSPGHWPGPLPRNSSFRYSFNQTTKQSIITQLLENTAQVNKKIKRCINEV